MERVAPPSATFWSELYLTCDVFFLLAGNPSALRKRPRFRQDESTADRYRNEGKIIRRLLIADSSVRDWHPFIQVCSSATLVLLTFLILNHRS